MRDHWLNSPKNVLTHLQSFRIVSKVRTFELCPLIVPRYFTAFICRHCFLGYQSYDFCVLKELSDLKPGSSIAQQVNDATDDKLVFIWLTCVCKTPFPLLIAIVL